MVVGGWRLAAGGWLHVITVVDVEPRSRPGRLADTLFCWALCPQVLCRYQSTCAHGSAVGPTSLHCIMPSGKIRNPPPRLQADAPVQARFDDSFQRPPAFFSPLLSYGVDLRSQSKVSCCHEVRCLLSLRRQTAGHDSMMVGWRDGGMVQRRVMPV